MTYIGCYEENEDFCPPTPDEKEIKRGLEDLRNPNWVEDLSHQIDKSHRGLGSPSHLALLSAVSAPLPSIPYTLCPIRSRINILLQGGPGSGKGLIMTIVERVAFECQQMGVATSPALVGTIDRIGDWTPGKAYYSRNRVLIIRELFQSFRTGEHFQDLAWDMNELVEYPHVISKTLASFKISTIKQESIRQKYPGVSFPHDNEFTYEAPCALIAGVPVMGLKEMYGRVTEGFLSRFIVVNISYDREQAAKASDNFWDNVMPEVRQRELERMLPKVELEKYGRMLRTLYLTCNSEFNITDVPAIIGYQLQKQEREALKNETRKAMLGAWDRVAENVLGRKDKDELDSVPPPLLFRQEQDVLRIALADAVSRRFAGTEVEPGVVRIDHRAMLMGLRYLPLIADTSVAMQTEAYRIHATRTHPIPMIFSSAYRIIDSAGPAGLSQLSFDTMCRENEIDIEKATRDLTTLLARGLVERKSDGNIAATIYKRVPD